MRKIVYLGMTCAFAALGAPAFAEDDKVEAVAQEKITAYTVLFSGGG